MFKLRLRKKPKPIPAIQEDHAELQLEDVNVKLSRKLNLLIPHEITVVIPRVELRDRQYVNGKLIAEKERIYNSITIVHAPRHPQENLPPPNPPKNPTFRLTKPKDCP